MSQSEPVFAFALMLPVHKLFHYRLAPGMDCSPGRRFMLPFGRGEKLGLLVAPVQDSSINADKIKTVDQLLDDDAVVSAHLLELSAWMAAYYCQPPGEVLFQCLPKYCRKGQRLQATTIEVWQAGEIDPAELAALHKKAPRQHELLAAIAASEDGLNAAQLRQIHDAWRQPLRALEARQWVKCEMRENLPDAVPLIPGFPLTDQQQQVTDDISSQLDKFAVHLLHGVTGSGKTEVYLALMQQVIAAGQQVIYLVPEIGLTPQLLQRLRQRLGPAVVSSHSAQSDFLRYQAWDQFRRGVADVIIGTRSALFTDAPRIGLIIVDEEHDASYRQQDGVRYHARDVAIMRAQMLDIPIVLGSATPSLESLYNLDKPHYHLHNLPHRPDRSDPPNIQLIDCHNSPLVSGCSPPLLQAIEKHLADEGQVLLFLNRRGFAPVVMCFECGWQASCHQCDARLTLHQSVNRLICHHCGYSRLAVDKCPDCGAGGVRHFGVGTQQLETFLAERFAQVDVLRIDRDSVSASTSLEQRLQPVKQGKPCILVGTQMLAKGHDYPNITLVGIIDADQALHSSFYRASERLVQTVLQVAGRAGRAERKGQALLQTAFAQHPLMKALCQQSYRELMEPILQERRLLGFPPFSRVVSFIVDATELELAMTRLKRVREMIDQFGPQPGCQVIGPIPALMTRRVGRYRAQLSIVGQQMQAVRALLNRLMPQLTAQRGSDKSHLVIEVDPVEL